MLNVQSLNTYRISHIPNPSPPSVLVFRASKLELILGTFHVPLPPSFCMTCKHEVIKDTFLTQHILQPTRYRESQQSNILDLVFTNEDLMVNNIICVPGLGKSDHCLITFDFICYNPKGPQR